MTTFCSRFALLHDSPWNHHESGLVRLRTAGPVLDADVSDDVCGETIVRRLRYVNLHPNQIATRRRAHHYLLESLVPLRTAMFERYWRARDRETRDDA